MAQNIEPSFPAAQRPDAEGTRAPRKTAARKTAAPTAAPAATSVKATSLADLAALIETVEFTSSADLQVFTEALRKLGHKLAVEVAMARGELEAALTAAIKADATFHVPGINARVSVKRVSKHLGNCADAFADAAASAVGAWKTMEQEFGEVMYPGGTPAPKTRPLFKFTG
jgi:hypothetical protein